MILNPLVMALQRWKIKRRGWAVAVVTFWGVLVFIGLAFAFGVPLADAITHLAQKLPGYVDAAEHGRGWIGHLVRKYHIQTWVQKNTPKLVSFGEGLTKPALSLGKGAVSLLLELFTIFVLTLLLLLEGPKMRVACSARWRRQRAKRYARIAHEVNRSVTGYMLGNFLTSIIAGDGRLRDAAGHRRAVPVPVGAVGGPGRLPADDRRRAGRHPHRAVRGRPTR